MMCEHCRQEVEPRIFAGYNTGGMKQIVKKCPACGENMKKHQPFYSYKDYDFDTLPLLYDDRTQYKCAVEGCENYIEQGTMNHHFFPKYLFGVELAEKAPQARLCKTHHMAEWHAKLTPNMCKKDLD